MREGSRQNARDTDRHRDRKSVRLTFSEPHCMFMFASSESFSVTQEEKKKEKEIEDGGEK